jgi:hypothetical protein
MITLFSAQLPTVMNILADGKQQTFAIKEQIPFVTAQVTVNVPTPESILNILPFITTPDQFAEIQRKFIQLKQQCKTAEASIQILIDQIDKVLGKLNRIEQIFSLLDGFLSFLSELVPIMKVLVGTMQVTLGAQVSPIISGTATVNAGDAIKFAKSKIKEIEALAKIANSVAEPTLQSVDELQGILLPTRTKLQEILTEIRARCFYLDSVLLDKLKELELSMTQNPPGGGGTSGPQGTGVIQDTEQIVNILASQFEPEEILNNLENSNKERFVEYLVENGFTGYQVVKK